MMTAAQMAQQYKVHPSTIYRATARANLPHAHGLTYDDRQVQIIASRLRKPAEPPPPKTPRAKKPPGKQARNARGQFQPKAAPAPEPPPIPELTLDDRLAQLEIQLAHMRAHIQMQEGWIAQLEQGARHASNRLNTHDHLLDVMVGWGKKINGYIRQLWRAMPDYEPGDTPAEFPAVRTDAEGSAQERRLAEEEKRTEAWAEGLGKAG